MFFVKFSRAKAAQDSDKDDSKKVIETVKAIVCNTVTGTVLVSGKTLPNWN